MLFFDIKHTLGMFDNIVSLKNLFLIFVETSLNNINYIYILEE